MAKGDQRILEDEALLLGIEGVQDYAIFLLDGSGRVTTWNRGAQRIKGYRADEIIGQHFSRFYSEEDVNAGKCERELEGATRDGRFEDEGWRVRKDGTRFWANVVITLVRDPQGRPFGFVKVTRDLSERIKADRDRALLQEARESGERTARLQATTAALSRVSTPEQAGEAVMAHGLSVLGAFGGGVYLLSDDGTLLRRLAARSPGPTGSNQYETVPLSAELPLTAAVRRRTALYFENQERLLREFPGLLRGGVAPEVKSAMVLPLLIDERLLGAISLTFVEPRIFTGQERKFADAIAQQCAQAIDRSLLAEFEHRARERSAFLAEASALLASSLNYDKVLESLAKLIVPSLADWCAIEMVEGETTTQVTIAHSDPLKVAWARELRLKHPPDRAQPKGIHRVIQTGTPELYPEVTDELIQKLPANDPYIEVLRNIGIKSALIVPLIAGAKPIGGITLAWAESARRYDRADLRFMLEVGQRAALALENSRLYREAQVAVQVRDEFLAVAGHELRTPLTALLMHVQSLHRSVRPDESAPKLKQRLEKAAASGERLEKLINQMLDVSRITAGRLKLEPEAMSLDELVREVVERSSELATRSRTPITLRLDSQVVGQWDPLRLDQVVTNLVSNAIKYGGGKPIEVEVRRDTEHAVLRVIDHGIGIEPNQQRKIFERFERAVASREYGGFGLGLWIARQIVDTSGGTIQVQSEPGCGATFTVTLPFGPPEQTDGVQ
jgi:PAS domain S-box-containing protein